MMFQLFVLYNILTILMSFSLTKKKKYQNPPKIGQKEINCNDLKPND